MPQTKRTPHTHSNEQFQTQTQAQTQTRTQETAPHPPPTSPPPPIPLSASASAADPDIPIVSADLLLYHDNDYGNASRLISVHGRNLRYCHQFKRWLIWDGQRWVLDDCSGANELASTAMLAYFRQAADNNQSEKAEAAIKSMNDYGVTHMLAQARNRLHISAADLDSDPYLLNFTNCTVDLRTGTRIPHSRAHYITKLIHHQYDPDEFDYTPSWQLFLSSITNGDKELELYLQRAVGYSLTGSTIEKSVFVLFGEGNNGKTTFLSTIRGLLKEYACLIQIESLMAKQDNPNNQADLADLCGRRFVMTSESEEGHRLSQGRLKRICQGMGTIKGVRKYENPFEFPETHKLWMDTNHKPTITEEDDPATFKRLHPIPFTNVIPKSKIDRELPYKLSVEAEGILVWAVEGARMWYRDRLDKPKIIEDETAKWQAESGWLERFLKECTVGGGSVPAEALYQSYREWADHGGEKDGARTQAKFGSKIKDKIPYKRDKSGRHYVGIQLRSSRMGKRVGSTVEEQSDDGDE